MTHQGEEITQDAWLGGLIDGGDGATILAGTFRKVGLIYYASKLNGISTGDHLYVTVFQAKPSQRFSFTFRCTDRSSFAFTLVESNVEDIRATEDVESSSPGTAGIWQRLELLEAGLAEVLRKLHAMQAVLPSSNESATAGDIPSHTPPQTLPQVLAWLVTQERVSIATLRGQLLPLDLFPGAVIDEINERALDLVGDTALEEVGDEIVVVSKVLAEVIASAK